MADPKRNSVSDRAWKGEEVIDLELSRLDTFYGSLRLVCPRADTVMERSMVRHGQLMPVVAGHSSKASRYELVDGFKRLRACRKLGFRILKARILEGGSRTLKAAIVHMNRRTSSISTMEEAMVVRSLHREDGLTQEEIAVLFGRHKSWACRRVALVEKLSEEVFEQLRLGLVSVSAGRELARLPRGNQEAVLRAVQSERLTRRETGRLVSILLSRPSWDYEALLRFPRETVENERLPEKEKPLGVLLDQVVEILQDGVDSLKSYLDCHGLESLPSKQRCVLERPLDEVERSVTRLRILIEEGYYGTDHHPQS